MRIRKPRATFRGQFSIRSFPAHLSACRTSGERAQSRRSVQKPKGTCLTCNEMQNRGAENTERGQTEAHPRECLLPQQLLLHLIEIVDFLLRGLKLRCDRRNGVDITCFDRLPNLGHFGGRFGQRVNHPSIFHSSSVASGHRRSPFPNRKQTARNRWLKMQVKSGVWGHTPYNSSHERSTH